MKKCYRILNLDCPNCALEVQEHLSKNEQIDKVDCNFAMKTLSISSKEHIDIETIRNLVKEVEQDAIIEELHIKSSFKKKKNWFLMARILCSIVFLIVGVFVNNFYAKISFFVVSYIVCAYDIIAKAFVGLFKSKNFFNENMLMSIATIGAFAIGEFLEACLVMILFQIGEMLEHYSVEKSTSEIMKSINSLDKTCCIVKDGCTQKIAYQDIQIGDVLFLKTGEMCPVEAEIIEGNADFDVSSVTGEFATQNLSLGEKIISSSIVVSGTIKAKALEIYENSNSVKILQLISQGRQNKAKSDKFISKFSKVYTPIVFGLALLLAVVPPLFNGEWFEYLYRALSFLVLACPCAVIISIPLTFFCGHGLCAKNGILVKGNKFLENLNDANVFVCDKTGTMTYGKFYVEQIYTSIDKDEFIETLCYGEALSNHPLAKSILHNFNIKVDTNRIKNYKEIAGNGVSLEFDGKNILVGGVPFLKNNNIDCKQVKMDNVGTVVCLAVENKMVGYVLLKDKIKDTSKQFIGYLKQNNIKTIMMTGDNKASGEEIASKIGFEQCYCELLPQSKVDKLQEIRRECNKKIAFVGDGLNDAGAIAVCDVGIAMAKHGNDITTENADVVVLGDEPKNIIVAHKACKKTCKKVKVNLFVALLTKFAFLVLSLLGLSFMWLAVLADVGLTVLLVLNSMLLLKAKIN